MEQRLLLVVKVAQRLGRLVELELQLNTIRDNPGLFGCEILGTSSWQPLCKQAVRKEPFAARPPPAVGKGDSPPQGGGLLRPVAG